MKFVSIIYGHCMQNGFCMSFEFMVGSFILHYHQISKRLEGVSYKVFLINHTECNYKSGDI